MRRCNADAAAGRGACTPSRVLCASSASGLGAHRCAPGAPRCAARAHYAQLPAAKRCHFAHTITLTALTPRDLLLTLVTRGARSLLLRRRLGRPLQLLLRRNHEGNERLVQGQNVLEPDFHAAHTSWMAAHMLKSTAEGGRAVVPCTAARPICVRTRPWHCLASQPRVKCASSTVQLRMHR
jgi:hypothetical protein